MERFAKEIKKYVEKALGDGFEVVFHDILKNNSTHKNAICIRKKGDKRFVAPSIYLEYFYSRFQKGVSLDDLAEEIIELYAEKLPSVNFDIESLKKPDKTKIFYQIINFRENNKLLDDIPHKKVEDLAIIFKYLVEKDCDGVKSFTINNNLSEMWGLDENVLYKLAQTNTPQLFPPSINSMEEVIFRMMEMQQEEQEQDFEEELSKLSGAISDDCFGIPTFVLSNNTGINGAAALLYPDVLKNIAKAIGEEELYILPSSIHETLLVPASFVHSQDITTFTNMVQEVNATQVLPEEKLSDGIYKFTANEILERQVMAHDKVS